MNRRASGFSAPLAADFDCRLTMTLKYRTEVRIAFDINRNPGPIVDMLVAALYSGLRLEIAHD